MRLVTAAIIRKLPPLKVSCSLTLRQSARALFTVTGASVSNYYLRAANWPTNLCAVNSPSRPATPFQKREKKEYGPFHFDCELSLTLLRGIISPSSEFRGNRTISDAREEYEPHKRHHKLKIQLKVG